jgi:hypothetical protein
MNYGCFQTVAEFLSLSEHDGTNRRFMFGVSWLAFHGWRFMVGVSWTAFHGWRGVLAVS